MSKGLPEMVGNIGFNYDDDKEEFGGGMRVVNISSCAEEEKIEITLSFNLGRKQYDDVSISLDAKEFMQKLVEAIFHGEEW